MEEVMFEIVGVKGGSGAHSRGKEKGIRRSGDERRKRSRRGGTHSSIVAYICFPSTHEAEARGPKVQAKSKLHSESPPENKQTNKQK